MTTPMTLTKRILGVLRTLRTGASMLCIEELINDNPDEFYANEHVIFTTITRCVKRGFILNEGKTQCQHCLAHLNNYRITPEGLIFYERGCSTRRVQQEGKED